MEMVAVSVGDGVNLNELQARVHTVFKEVVNCQVNGGNIVSIVTPIVGSGPNNIVINGEDLALFNRFGQNNFSLSFIDFSDAKVFDSKISADNFEINEFLSNLNLLERILIKESSTLSCSFMLDERRKSFFITPFEKNLRDYIQNTYFKFIDGSTEEVNNLKGVGFGLTPQGDDLISGTLISIFLYGLVKKISTEKIRRKIYELAKTDNEISNSFLFYASQGRVYAKFKDLLEALMSSRNEIYSSATRFLDIGETSGADVSTAFILAAKKLFKGGLPWL